MTGKTMSLDDLFKETEDKLVAEHREREAREKAAWDALSPEEQARLNAEREARMALFDTEGTDNEEGRETCEQCGEPLHFGDEGICVACAEDEDEEGEED